MDANQYKAAKIFMGIKNPDIWCNILGISKDTDKSYSCGRLSIPTSNNIEGLMEGKRRKVEILKKSLESIFAKEKYDLQHDLLSNDIKITSIMGSEILFSNSGKDHFGQDIYSFSTKGSFGNILLFYPKSGPIPGRVYSINDCDWFYWRTESMVDGRYRENGPNPLTKKLFEQCLCFAI
jgi:hypothetical protein